MSIVHARNATTQVVIDACEVVVVLLGLFFTNLGCSCVFRVFVPALSVFSKCTCRSW